MLASSLGLTALSDWLLVRPPVRTLLGRAALVGLVAVALAAPYYVQAREHVLAYVRDNIFERDKDIWAYPGTAEDHFGYYLWGIGARWMLGTYLPVLAALLACGLVYVVAARRKELLMRGAAYAGVTLVAWALITVIGVKYGFYGLTFFLLAVGGGVMSLRLLFAGERPAPDWLRWALAAALAVLGMRAAVRPQLHMIWNPAGPAYSEAVDRAYGDLLAALRERRREDHPVVFLTMQSPLNPQTLQWLERQRTGECRFRFTQPGFWRDLEPFRQSMESSSFIVAYETATPEATYPWARLAPETLALARSLEGYAEVGSFPAPDGVVYHLFEKTPPDGPAPVSDNRGK
jgi:hypothetical protein